MPNRSHRSPATTRGVCRSRHRGSYKEPLHVWQIEHQREAARIGSVVAKFLVAHSLVLRLDDLGNLFCCHIARQLDITHTAAIGEAEELNPLGDQRTFPDKSDQKRVPTKRTVGRISLDVAATPLHTLLRCGSAGSMLCESRRRPASARSRSLVSRSISARRR